MPASEKIEAAIALRRGESIPVAPLIISFAGRCAGMTQADIFSSLHKWQEALGATFKRVGTPDAIFPLWPRDAAKSQMLRPYYLAMSLNLMHNSNILRAK